MKVWKYVLTIDHPCIVAMPAGAKLLHVGAQGDDLCLWALVNLTHGVVERQFFVYGTGHPIDESGLSFIGSAQMNSDGMALVWHVFEDRR